MKNPMVSVIMPIYKAEKYIKKCVDSILNQRFKDFELILVDDGSPDKCPSICDDYARKDDRVRVIHKKNGGSVLARKAGLELASGRYISFIDSDDWLEPDMYSHMLELVDDDVDMVAVGFIQEGSSSIECGNGYRSGIYEDAELKKLKSKSLYTGVFYEAGIMPALWTKIIKRELMNTITFPNKEIKMGEDAAITYQVVANCKKIIIDNEFRPYHYRVLANSMSHRFDIHYFSRAESLICFLDEKLNDVEMHDQLKYYKLFLLQLGAEQLVSPRNKMFPFKKIKLLRDNYNNYNKIFEVTSIDWSGFSSSLKRELQALLSKKIVVYFILYYMRKVYKIEGNKYAKNTD